MASGARRAKRSHLRVSEGLSPKRTSGDGARAAPAHHRRMPYTRTSRRTPVIDDEPQAEPDGITSSATQSTAREPTASGFHVALLDALQIPLPHAAEQQAEIRVGTER